MTTKLAEVRVGKLAANLVAALATVLLSAVGIALCHLLPHYKPPALWHAWALFAGVIVTIPLHEALHGLGLFLFAGVSRSQMRFGVWWRSLIFYCHCAVPIPLQAYRRMALLPLWVTGGTALLALLVFPADWLGVLMGVTWASATGDVWIVAKSRRFSGDLLVRDDLANIGCDVLAPEVRPDAAAKAD